MGEGRGLGGQGKGEKPTLRMFGKAVWKPNLLFYNFPVWLELPYTR